MICQKCRKEVDLFFQKEIEELQSNKNNTLTLSISQYLQKLKTNLLEQNEKI